MSSLLRLLHCEYHYDPLDRLISQAQSNAPVHQRFYCISRLATEVQGELLQSIFQHGDLLFAQKQHFGDAVDTSLLATDQQRSVLHTLKNNEPPQSIAYSAYGYPRAESGLTSLLGYNGERPDPVTGHYLLGNGYRAFNPVLMRFNSPDSWSPFGKGGLNSYAYCQGNPVGRTDPTGHISILLSKALSLLPETAKGNFIGYYVGAKKPLINLMNGGKLAGAAMHADGARLGPGLYATSDIKIAQAFLKRADPKSGAQMFGVHHTGEPSVRAYGPGLHPDADLQTIAQAGTTYRIPSTQYENLILTESMSAPPAAPAAASISPPRAQSPGGGGGGGVVSAAATRAPRPVPPQVHIPEQPAAGVGAMAGLDMGGIGRGAIRLRAERIRAPGG